MKYLLMLVLAMGVSLFVIPLAARLAPRFGLIDEPNERKVHVNARASRWRRGDRARCRVDGPHLGPL